MKKIQICAIIGNISRGCFQLNDKQKETEEKEPLTPEQLEEKFQQNLIEIKEAIEETREKLQTRNFTVTDDEIDDITDDLKELLDKANAVKKLKIKKFPISSDYWNEPSFTQKIVMEFARNNPRFLKERMVYVPHFDEQDLLRDDKQIPWWGLKFAKSEVTFPSYDTVEIFIVWGHKIKKSNEWRYPTEMKENTTSLHFIYIDEEWVYVPLHKRRDKKKTDEEEKLIDLWDKALEEHANNLKKMVAFGRYFDNILHDLLTNHVSPGDTQKEGLGANVKTRRAIYQKIYDYFPLAELHLNILEFQKEITTLEKEENLKVIEEAKLFIQACFHFFNSLQDEEATFANASNSCLDQVKDFIKTQEFSLLYPLIINQELNLLGETDKWLRYIFAKREDNPLKDLPDSEKVKGVLSVHKEKGTICRTIPAIEQKRGMTNAQWSTNDQEELDRYLFNLPVPIKRLSHLRKKQD